MTESEDQGSLYPGLTPMVKISIQQRSLYFYSKEDLKYSGLGTAGKSIRARKPPLIKPEVAIEEKKMTMLQEEVNFPQIEEPFQEKEAAQIDLDTLELAVTRMKELTRTDIVEIRSYVSPHSKIQLILEAICILFDCWKQKIVEGKIWIVPDVKGCFANATEFLKKVRDFDQTRVENKKIVGIKKKMEQIKSLTTKTDITSIPIQILYKVVEKL